MSDPTDLEPMGWAALAESDDWWRTKFAQSRNLALLAEHLELPIEDVHARLQMTGLELRGIIPRGGQLRLFELPKRRLRRWEIAVDWEPKSCRVGVFEVVAYATHGAFAKARDHARQELQTHIPSSALTCRVVAVAWCDRETDEPMARCQSAESPCVGE